MWHEGEVVHVSGVEAPDLSHLLAGYRFTSRELHKKIGTKRHAARREGGTTKGGERGFRQSADPCLNLH